MGRKVKNLHYLRNTNRISIIKRLATIGYSSRIELSHELGLSKMTITNLVTDLIADNLVMESDLDITTNINGRKRTALVIPDFRINAIGLYIERYMIHCIAMDINGTEFYYDSKKIPQNIDRKQVISIILRLLHRLVNKLSEYNFSGIGISSIGPLDMSTSTILNPTNFNAIEDLPLGEIIFNEFHLPTYMINCMSASVLAEHLYGQARNVNDVIYLGLGTGVGAGIIIDQRIFTGKEGFAGELGHMSININGPECSCGQYGCLETYTSLFSILKNTGYSTIQDLVKDLNKGHVSNEALFAIEKYKKALTTALVTISNTFDPDMIILGDKCLPLIELYLDDLNDALNSTMIQHGARTIPISISSFSERAPLIGASALIFDKIFSESLPIINKSFGT